MCLGCGGEGGESSFEMDDVLLTVRDLYGCEGRNALVVCSTCRDLAGQKVGWRNTQNGLGRGHGGGESRKCAEELGST